jgi:hypothetical protein
MGCAIPDKNQRNAPCLTPPYVKRRLLMPYFVIRFAGALVFLAVFTVFAVLAFFTVFAGTLVFTAALFCLAYFRLRSSMYSQQSVQRVWPFFTRPPQRGHLPDDMRS